MKRLLSLEILVLSILLTSAMGASRFFPQVGDGEFGATRLQTSFIFVNAGPDVEFTLEVFDGNGTPMELELSNLGTDSSFAINLPTGQAIEAKTPGTGSIKVGYARIDAPETVGGTAVFTGTDVPSGTVLYEAGVPASPAVESFSIFVDSLGKRNTGVALVAPAASAVPAEATNQTLTFTLYDLAYQQVGVAELTLAPGQKIARFVDELFAPGSPERNQASEMQGTLAVTSQGGTAAAVTLRQLAAQAFPVGVPVLTTFPVVRGTATEPSGWQLVWSDEFDGPSIDPTKWEHQIGIGQGGWGNNELEYYTARPENSRIEDGKLVIEARKDVYNDGHVSRSYTSARMRTMNKGDWKYGRLEIRAKLPKGKGIWPAIWMLPTDNTYGTWAASGEIDIMELVGHEPNKVHGTLHYGGEWPRQISSGGTYTLPSGNFSDNFHIFVLEWAEREMKWYVDDIHFLTQNSWHSNSANTPAPFPAPFDQRFHMLLNVAVGGNWPGTPDSSTVFPQRMEIDYVRIFQPK